MINAAKQCRRNVAAVAPESHYDIEFELSSAEHSLGDGYNDLPAEIDAMRNTNTLIEKARTTDTLQLGFTGKPERMCRHP